MRGSRRRWRSLARPAAVLKLSSPSASTQTIVECGEPSCRSVVTVHDLGYHYFPEVHPPAQRLYLEWSTRYAVRHASRLIAVSQATKHDLVKKTRKRAA